MPLHDSSPEALARLIREHQPCVALTGAGASTESGIPDFRSPTGMWAGFDPREYATLGAFRRDPEKVWRFYAPRFSMLADAEPNRAHRALADLEGMGLLRAVVTQNIDLLHRRAGSCDVIEVHGSIATSTCPACRTRLALDEVLPLLQAGDGAPHCPACGEVLKPDVVFFDELLPEEAIDRAYALAREARLLLVVGSSLEVFPVAGLPQETIDAGGFVAVVNRGKTWVDDQAALTLDTSAGDALAEAVARVRGGHPVALAEPDEAWPRRFAEERDRLLEALGAGVVEIEHMGSTAVRGLPAKPILDISVGLERLELRPEQVRALEELGYEYLSEYGLPGRLYLRKGGAERTHHLHVVEHGAERWHSHLSLREYLRAHPDEAVAYGEEKRRIAAEARDSEDYWECKQPYMEALVGRAWRWYESRR